MTKTNIERTEERKNRFTGESIKLTKEEATKHDAIFLCEVMATLEKNHLVQKCGDKPAKGDGGGQAKKLYKPTKAAIDLYGKANV